MPQVGFEPMTPVFELVKTVHAIGHTATVISKGQLYLYLKCPVCLTRQHVITFLVFKFVASSQTLNLAGYGEELS
jgi:hypothetical protein